MNPVLQDKLLTSNQYANVGRYTYGTPTFVPYLSATKMSIGSFCSIADKVTFIMGGQHYMKYVTTYPLNIVFEDQDLPWHEFQKSPIVIGNDVWIGYGATILSGVKIGDGSVIGAQSVVRHNVEPYSIVAGNTAIEIGKRFNDNKIKELLQIKWWDWPIETIQEKASWLMSEI